MYVELGRVTRPCDELPPDECARRQSSKTALYLNNCASFARSRRCSGGLDVRVELFVEVVACGCIVDIHCNYSVAFDVDLDHVGSHSNYPGPQVIRRDRGGSPIELSEWLCMYAIVVKNCGISDQEQVKSSLASNWQTRAICRLWFFCVIRYGGTVGALYARWPERPRPQRSISRLLHHPYVPRCAKRYETLWALIVRPRPFRSEIAIHPQRT